ncbi:MAG TPA: MnmC family methyltransferase [Spirochaetota bacterium]|nr:MnmC family methyltransferase [Spirochaetota bacterium]HOM37701.1 MnmC family methyltransferase [Spirochaetota bacterium]HPQ49659.1 MnmC family methyltransferase [Spirochaetota bacterium]
MKYIKTADNSLTLYSEEYQETYHTVAGAYSEAINKFIEPSGILDCPDNKRLLDIGFGLGYNSFVLLDLLLNKKSDISFSIYSVEKNKSLLSYCFFEKYAEYYKRLEKDGEFKINNIYFKLFIGDARLIIKNFEKKFFDLVFLDPFSPPKNPELWTLQFFRNIKSLLKDDGKVLTYSSALPVISAFLKAGFYVGYTPGFGRKRGGLIASLKKEDIKKELTEDDYFLVKNSARAIPNYDKGLWDKDKIVEYRNKLISMAKLYHIRMPHKKALSLLKKNIKTCS